MNADRFSWRSYDINSVLPVQWKEDIKNVADTYGIDKFLLPRSVTSREANMNEKILVRTVNGAVLRQHLPWLYDLYAGYFKDLIQKHHAETVAIAKNDLYGATLNIQSGVNMRYESHVDSNPIEGLLYVTSHPQGAGGELVVANNSVARSVAEIDTDCSIVYPQSGNIIYFDARRFPHYVRPLVSNNEKRIVVAMNYYLPSAIEENRPADLNDHLFGVSK